MLFMVCQPTVKFRLLYFIVTYTRVVICVKGSQLGIDVVFRNMNPCWLEHLPTFPNISLSASSDYSKSTVTSVAIYQSIRQHILPDFYLQFVTIFSWAEIAQSVYRLAKGWAVRGSIPVGGEIFRTRPDRPWGPPSLLYNGYRRWPHTPSSAEVKERVELYLYSTSGPSWPVRGWTIPLP